MAPPKQAPPVLEDVEMAAASQLNYASPVEMTVVVTPTTQTMNRDPESIAGEDADGEEAHNPNAVANLPLSIRINFRFKMLALVTMNTFGICLIAFLVAIFNPFNLRGRGDVILMSLMIFFASMIFMNMWKTKYPHNYISLFVFTLAAGFFFGVAQPAFRSYAGFQIICYLFLLSLFFLIYSTNTWPLCQNLDSRPPPEMMPLPTAAGCAWFTLFVISLVIVCVFQFSLGGHYASIIIFMGMLSWYYSYDTLNIELELGPEDYMFGVVHFWADMIMCICCCACIACFGGMA